MLIPVPTTYNFDCAMEYFFFFNTRPNRQWTDVFEHRHLFSHPYKNVIVLY